MRSRWLAVVGMLGLTQCLLDTNGTQVGAGGGGAGGGDDPSCPGGCVPSSECMVSQCVDGACQETPANPTTVCGENRDKFCDGEGACKLPRGLPCTEDDECLSDHCTDAVCCEVECAGTCEHCDAPDRIGECVLRGPGTQDETCGANISCDGLGFCAPGLSSWAWSAGSTNNDIVTAVAASPDGSSWAALEFEGTASVNGTDYFSLGDDVLLIKLSNTGGVIQVVPLGGNGDENVTRLVTDQAGNVYAGGFFDQELDGPGGTLNADQADGFVIALDGTGAHRWTRQIEGAGNQRVYDVIALAGGGVGAAGEFTDEVTIDGETVDNNSSGESDSFVVNLSATGSRVWTRPLASDDIQVVTGLCQAPDGSLFAVGTFEGDMMLDVLRSTPDFEFDIFVAQLNPSMGGVVTSSFQLGNDDANQEGRRIGCLPDGGLVLTGHYGEGGTNDDLGIGVPGVNNVGSSDIFAAIIESDGTLRRRLLATGSAFDDRLQGLAVDAAGNVTVAGHIEGSVNVAGNVLVANGFGATLVAKFTPAGELYWARSFDGIGFDGSDAVSTNDDGLVWVGGFFEDMVTVAPGANAMPPMITSTGLTDGFVFRLSP